MKIEKVNDHQIRCTLTREDLASRRLKMSELAYGSEKARDLFRDMMEKANIEYGFEAGNIPLMIEAIPVSGECIVLVITKVEDPEELDTRFSKFAPDIDEETDEFSDDADGDSSEEEAANIADLFKRFKEAVDTKEEKPASKEPFNGMAFSFTDIMALSNVCKQVRDRFDGTGSLYQNADGEYILTINRGKTDFADFVPICNIFSEFGSSIKNKAICENYLKEHYETVIEDTAVSTLADF
ncbi:MAG: adaptor protein MecA [Lachnospiraceae bacterium]|nr:adaptor protein MecA [Lachnospiraceae bacterium]